MYDNLVTLLTTPTSLRRISPNHNTVEGRPCVVDYFFFVVVVCVCCDEILEQRRIEEREVSARDAEDV